jgi:hypothetical protein
MKIFEEKELLKPGYFARIIGKQPKGNALIEINNLLAANQTNLKNISLDKILEIAERYNVDINDMDHQFRCDLFKSYLDYCLADKKIEEHEISDLEHLKHILLLNEVKETIKDGQLDIIKKENLKKLQSDLLLPDNLAQSILSDKTTEVYEKYLDDAIKDERLSIDEELELERIAKNLGIDPKYSDNKKENLNRYRLYWQIENGYLPILTPDIAIQKTETLHFRSDIDWLEQRRITKRINYWGPVARIKIMKGVYYRIGSIGGERVSEDSWQMIDRGVLYLTNKRIIFIGQRGDKNIPINKILDFKPYKNGIDIQKDSGESPFLKFENNIDLFSMILARIMSY